MKKKEVEKFVDEVGLSLYEELTKIDNQQWEDIPEKELKEMRKKSKSLKNKDGKYS